MVLCAALASLSLSLYSWCLTCCCSGYCIPCVRGKLRTKHNLKHTLVEGPLDDWLACIVPGWNCVSICQMANEMETRKKNGGAPAQAQMDR
jgi:hypothetical protein